MIRKRLLAEASWSSTWRSMTSLMRSSLRSCREREPRKGFKRIVGTHPRYDAGGEKRMGTGGGVRKPKAGKVRGKGKLFPNEKIGWDMNVLCIRAGFRR